MHRRLLARAGSLIAVLAAAPHSVAAQQPEPLSDNSFLIEEAYNQDPGVVQHISTFGRGRGGDWAASFTQEWPYRRRAHQLSYTVQLIHGNGTGFGDLLLNYRYQAIGGADAIVAMSPRLSAVIPTGSVDRGRGAGSVGAQIALPVSYHVVPALALHANAGLTWYPHAEHPGGAHASTMNYAVGASAIWLARSRFNLMVEWIWQDNEGVTATGGTLRERAMFINPGVRFGWDSPGGLQIVPGVAYTIGLGPSEGQDGVFLYLSFEHSF
ncbi:MAG: transporter [Gemmatimonadales bacterium]